MRAGDIFTYTPSSNWCRHGIAIVYADHAGALRANDTYWGQLEQRYSEHGEISISILSQDNYLGNADEFRKVHREEYEKYAHTDTLWIPIGGRSEAFFVKKDAKIDTAKAIEYLREQIEEQRGKISSAEYRIKLHEKEISELGG